jgi:hypothetical protein
MMGRQLTVEMTKADGEIVQRMCLALAGLIERPMTPKFYIGAMSPPRTRQKMLEVE